MEKVCTQCGESKDHSHFYSHSSTKDRLANICKVCHLSNSKKRLKDPKNKERAKLSQKKWRADPKNKRANLSSRYKAKYGITLDTYEEMLASQDNKCYLCGNEENYNGKPLYVDHCHTSGKIRKLLCQHCNTGLGMFRDNPELLIKAADYVKEHND
jgi:hypothetical protein